MSVYQLIQSTLEQSGVDVFFNKYDADTAKDMPNTYIVWFEMLNQGELYADDREVETGHHFQINIFSKTNYNSLTKTINNLMKKAGFKRRYERDLPWNKDTEYYNRVQRYYIHQEVI